MDPKLYSALGNQGDTSMGGNGSYRQFTTFFLDQHYLGIDVLKVQEVLTSQDMTRVPLAPKMIAGLINLRGKILTAIDLRIRLGFPERQHGSQTMNVVVQIADGEVSFLVDRIGGVIEVKPELFEPPPDILNQRLKDVTHGVYKLKDQLLITLNTEAIV